MTNNMNFARLFIYSALIFFCLVYLMPLFVMVITSFKTLPDIKAGNLMSLPKEWVFDAWYKAWDGACTGVKCEGVKGYFWNSFQMVIPAVAISTLLGAFNGYVVTKWQFRGSNLFFSLLLFGCFIPFQVILLPMAAVLGKLGLANTTAGLVTVHVIYGMAFTTLFFRCLLYTSPSPRDGRISRMPSSA